MSKMMVPYLESFLRVSPFRETQDSRVDTSILVLDKIGNPSYVKYVEHKMLQWYTKFPTNNTVAAVVGLLTQALVPRPTSTPMHQLHIFFQIVHSVTFAQFFL
jgi:hypothetical protein